MSVSFLDQTANTISLVTLKRQNYDFINHKADALKCPAFLRIFFFMLLPIGSPQILSLVAPRLDNNYLTDFIAEGESLLPCQPFL